MTDQGQPLRPGVCPKCGEPIDFTFERSLSDVAAMIFGKEWVALESIPVELFCTASCGFRQASMGHQFTIDTEKGVVLFGRIDKP